MSIHSDGMSIGGSARTAVDLATGAEQRHFVEKMICDLLEIFPKWPVGQSSPGWRFHVGGSAARRHVLILVDQQGAVPSRTQVVAEDDDLGEGLIGFDGSDDAYQCLFPFEYCS